MKIPFRDYHFLQLLNFYEANSLPLDVCVHKYFRSHPSLGSKDRAKIANTVFDMIRWKGIVDAKVNPPYTWEKRLDVWKNINLELCQSDNSLPNFIQVSFPEQLFNKLANSYGVSKAIELCQVCNTQAPVTLRVNTLKADRDGLLKKWGEQAIPCKISKNGIFFEKRCQVFQFPEFKLGFFEVQDEGSQLLSELVQAKAGDQVLDYCGGSGGKVLAFAPNMQNLGQVYLHDVRSSVLKEAKKRLKRSGIQNTQIVFTDSKKLKELKKRMDWVLVDVPCSGTGTLRRNPDLKWKYSDEMLLRLIDQQRQIFEKALSFLAPEGKIVYGTCSLLCEENQDQVAYFLKAHQLELVDDPFQVFPQFGAMDGFFGAVMKRM